jgi:CBS domain-containing protein
MPTAADVMTSRLVAASPDVTVADAVRRMVDAGVGSVVILDGSRLEGIFTERDVLRLAADGADLATISVADVMTRAVVTAAPDDDPVAVAHLMADRRIRHLPVTVGEQVLGVVGIREIVRVLLERAYGSHDTDARDTARDLLGHPSLSSPAEGA